MVAVTLHGITDELSPENERYSEALSTASDAYREAEAIFSDKAYLQKPDWTLEAKSDKGDAVHSKASEHGKVIAISTVLPCSVTAVMEEGWKGVSKMAEWNKGISFAQTIVTLTDHADIVATGNNGILLISGRDFVTVRIYRPLPSGGYIMANRSVEVAEFPEQHGKIRAHLYLCAAWIRPDPAAPAERTLSDTIISADMKGYLPKMLIERVIPKAMLKDLAENMSHYIELAAAEKAARTLPN